MKSIEEEKSSFESHFIKKSDIVYFLDSIEKLSKSVGASTSIVTVNEDQDKAELALSLSVEGSFESIYKFLMLLENAPYEIEIVDFDIEKGGSVVTATNSIENWKASFKIKLLSFSK